MGIKDFKKIRKFRKNTKCSVHITKKHGLPFFLYKHKKRKALVIGIIIFFAILSFLTQFIWIIEITGNENITYEEILKCANDGGLHTGMPAGRVNSAEIQSYMMTNMEKLSFVSVNRKGSTVTIDVREREDKRKHFDKDTPTNIVASKSGVIESILVQSGTAIVKKGDIVYEGQLLVSGAEDSKVLGIKYSHSDAEIKARVWYEETVELPYYKVEKVKTGNIKSKNKLKIFDFSINLFIKNKILFEKYDILSYTKYISLGNGKIIPFGIEINKYSEYTEKRTKLSAYETKKYLTEKFDKMCKGSEIVKRDFKTNDNKLTVIYECIEDIVKEEVINDGGKIS